MNCFLAVLVAVVVPCAFSLRLQNVFEYEMKEAVKNVPLDSLKNELHNILDLPIVKKLTDVASVSSVKLKSFSWKDCGTSSADVNIKTLSITPDPLTFPGPLIVATTFTIKKTLSAKLKADLKMYVKLRGSWTEIPCLGNFGSCKFDDMCALLANIKDACPEELKKIGITCACPLKAQSYTLPKTTFDIMASIIPAGEYHIIANVTQNSDEALCLDTYLTVE